MPLSSSLIDSAVFPPRTLPDGTPITSENKENETTFNYYMTYVYESDRLVNGVVGTPAYTLYIGWLQDTYGLNWLERFWSGAESFVFGMGDAVTSAIDGLCYIIQHPIKTAEGLLFLYKASHPLQYPAESLLLAQLTQAAIQNCWNDFTEGDYNKKCRMIGRVVGEIVLAFVSAKGINVAMETLQNSALFTKIMSRVGKGAITADEAVLALKEASDIPPETLNLIDRLLGEIDDTRALLPTSALRKSGNMAIAEINIPGVPSELKAFSRVNYAADMGADQGFTLLKSQRVFNTLEIDGYDRAVDTEAKILEEIASRLGNNPNATGTIQLLTENPPCASCQSVFQQFRQRYPNIQLKILDGLYKVTDW